MELLTIQLVLHTAAVPKTDAVLPMKVQSESHQSKGK